MTTGIDKALIMKLTEDIKNLAYELQVSQVAHEKEIERLTRERDSVLAELHHHFGCDPECEKRHERLYTKADVEAIGEMIIAGKSVAEALRGGEAVSDLVERLRDFDPGDDHLGLREEAADEIERLTREVTYLKGLYHLELATSDQLRAALELAVDLLRQSFADESVWEMYWAKSKEAAPLREALRGEKP